MEGVGIFSVVGKIPSVADDYVSFSSLLIAVIWMCCNQVCSKNLYLKEG